MIPDAALRAQLAHTLEKTELPALGELYRGKVRDNYAGKAGAYGIDWPKGLKKDQALAEPTITPSTKAEYGAHDQPISEAEILKGKLVEPGMWKQAVEVARKLFARGQAWAKERG